MASILSIVQTNNTATTLFNLNDPTGAESGEYGSVQTDLLANPSFGAPRWDFDRAEPPGLTGGVTTFQRAGLKEMTLALRIRGTSYDNLATAVGRLGDLLSNGCTMKWVANGSSQTRYIDVEPSPSPVLLDGRELALYEATSLFDTPQGVTLNLTVQPFMRGDALAPTVNVLTDATMLRDQEGDGDPDLWPEVGGPVTSKSIHAATESFQWTGTVAAASVSQIYNGATSGQVWTGSADVWYVSGASGDIRIQLAFLTAADATLATTDSVAITTTGTGFRRLTVSATAPGTTAKVRLLVRTAGSATAVYRARNAQVELATTASPFRVGTETVSMVPTNTGFAKVIPIYNPGEAPAPCSFTITAPDAGSTITDVYMAMKSSRRQTGAGALTDFLNGPFHARCDATANGWTVALGTGTTDGGTYANINHATDPMEYKKRVTLTRTTKLDALRGEHDVWARIRAEGAEKFYTQLRWGPNGGTPVPYTLPEVTHDTTNAATFGWVMVKLGRIRIPKETSVTLGTLTLELWTHTGTADVDMRIEYLHFMPVEQQAHIEAPAGATVTWLGSELVTPVANPAGGTAGTVSGTTLRLDNTNDNCGTPTAYVFEPGLHKVTWHMVDGVGGPLISADMHVRNTNTSVYTYSDLGFSPPGEIVGRFTAAASPQTYQLQVDDPSPTEIVSYIRDEFIPVLAQNEKLRTDPGSLPTRYAVEKLNSSSVLVSDFDANMVPFIVPPGLSLVSFEVLDAPLVNYTEPQSVDARTITVAATVYPRYPV